MTARTSLSRVAALAALLVLPPVVIAQGPPKARERAVRAALTFDTATGQRIRVTQVVGGLVHPYSLAFPDAHTILVAERSGRLRIIRDGVLLPKPVWEAPPAPPESPPSNNPPDALHLHLIERYTRTGSDQMRYEVTVDDPDTFERPYTAALDLKPQAGIYEYACHEGNRGLENILRAASVEER